MTNEEAKEKYGDVILKFTAYYKYKFVFMGENEEVWIRAEYGGSAEDIYKYDVSANQTHAFQIWEGWFDRVRITDKSTKQVIFEHDISNY